MKRHFGALCLSTRAFNNTSFFLKSSFRIYKSRTQGFLSTEKTSEMSDVEENHEDEMQQGEGEENAVEEKGVPLTKGTI